MFSTQICQDLIGISRDLIVASRFIARNPNFGGSVPLISEACSSKYAIRYLLMVFVTVLVVVCRL